MKSRFLPSKALGLTLLVLPVIAGILATVPSCALSGTHRGGGYLGVDFENLTDHQREKFQVPPKEGVAIAAVDHDAPAGKAGLHANDVILQMNGKNAQRAEELREAIRKMQPGQRVVLDILRKGQTLQISVLLADRKTVEQEAWSQHYSVPNPKDEQESSFFGAVPSEISKTFSSNGGLMRHIPGTLPYTGIFFDVMNRQLAEYFGLKNSTGLLVRSIEPNSPGYRAGLQAGDVICRASDAPMTSRSAWAHVLKGNRHDAIKLKIMRHRELQTLILILAESKS